MALCTDCTSKIEYQGDGSQSKFTFDFEYMESSDVYVAAWDDEKKEYYNLNGSTDWRFDNATTIEILPAPEYKFVIYRCTEIDPLKAEFFPGHPVKASDLNDNFTQLQQGLEDARCSIDGLKEDVSDNNWNNHNQTIKCEDPWESDDEHLSTTCAQDKRFWNKEDETVRSTSERFSYDDEHVATTRAIEDRFWNSVKDSDSTYTTSDWNSHAASPDSYVPTTGAVEKRIAKFITDEELHEHFVTGDEQRNGLWDETNTDDTHIPTTDAVVERHDTWYSDNHLAIGHSVPPMTRHGNHGGGNNADLDPNDEDKVNYIQPGKFWVNTETQRLAYWNNSNPNAGYWVHVAAMPANDAPPVYVSDEEPTGSFIEEGDLWWNKTDGTLYVRYCPDPSGSCQWVDASPSFAGDSNIEVEAPLAKTVEAITDKTTISFNINSLSYIP